MVGDLIAAGSMVGGLMVGGGGTRCGPSPPWIFVGWGPGFRHWPMGRRAGLWVPLR